ncbi:MAG: M6 family metalloprotease domain-containing protein [Bacteroidales bacterium]
MKSIFFTRSLFLFLLLIAANFAYAGYFRNISVRISQPNGANLTVFASGDEFYNWIHDAQNFTIVKDPSTGYFVYASLQGTDLVTTPWIVGESDPASAGLMPGINIPGWKMELIRRDFLEATPQKPTIIPPFSMLNSDVAGTINNIVVFIRFNDQSEFTEPLTTYDDMFNDDNAGENSMYNYFKDVSYNTTFVTSTFYPIPAGTVIVSYQDSHDRNYYVPYDEETNPEGYQDGDRTSREHTLLKNAVEAIASQVPDGLNVDYDDDGYVDNVCFIIKGTTTEWSTLLWPHRWSLFSQTCFINGAQVWDYNFQLETFLSGSGVGVLAHEMMHTFGCPDLYHYNGDGFSPVGPWDLMDGNTNPPQHIGAFQKKKYTGWITDIPTITSPGTYTLNPLASSTNNSYKLLSPNSTTEFFVFEYRRKTGTFEGALPASGLLIYRINTLAGNGNAGGPPDEIYLYRPGGTDTTNGSVYSGYFSLASGRTTFSDITNPNDWLSDGTTMGGINISNVTAADATISFTVNMNTLAEFTASITTTCINTTVLLTDQSFAAPTSWIWSISPNTYVFVNGTTASSQNPQVQFSAAGDYSVTLTASGPNGSSTLTKTDYIHILPSYAPPLLENFESGTLTTNNWTVNNPDDLTTWSFFNTAGGNSPSTKCLTMNFYNYESYPAVDELISKPIALSSGGTATLTFKVAYRQYNSSFHDSLKVYISTNCGSTYSYNPYAKGDALLATGSPTTNFFVPSVPADWRTDTIDLTSFLGQTVTVKFRAINGYGNNLYLDDINLTGVAPVLSNFTGTPTTICQGESVQFTDQSSGNPTSWMWNFGDGSFSTLQNPSHIYNTEGQFSVTLTVTKPGSSNTLTRANYITVNALQTVTANISQNPPGSLCPNSSVTFNASVTNGGTNPFYQWKKNGANVGSNSSSYSASNLVNGDNINCYVTSAITCPANNPAISNTIQVSVLQNLTPSVSIVPSPSLIVCQGTEVTFTANPVNGGSVPSYQWKKNGLNVGSNAPVFITNTLSSGDVITCVMTSSFPCVTVNPVTSNVIVMTVNNTVSAAVSVSASPSGSICEGDNVVFTATTVNGGTAPVYQWRVNNLTVGNNSSTFSSNSLQQGDVVTCQLTSNAPCVINNPALSNSITMNVTAPSVLGVAIVANPSNEICQGSSITFSAQVTNGGEIIYYTWLRNNIEAGHNPTYTANNFSNGDNISCVVSSQGTCLSGSPATSDPITMIVHPQLPVSVTISHSPSGSVCAATPVTFTATVTNGGDNPSYQWKRNNAIVSTDPVFISSALSNGDLIKCTVTSSESCVSSNPATSTTLVMSVLPSYPVSVSIVSNPGNAVCAGEVITFNAIPANGGSSPSYEWFVNELSVGSGSTFTSSVLPDNAAVSCILTSSIPNCALGNPATSNIIVTDIHPLPLISLGNDTTIPSSDSILLDAGAGFSTYNWSTGENTQTILVSESGSYSVTVTNDNSCSGNDEIIITVGYSEIQGYLTYNNAAATPMNNSTVNIKQGSAIVATTTTDNLGHYAFNGIAQGTYKLAPSSTKAWGGVNSTDALLIMKHFVGMTYLYGLPLKAANVDNFTAINSLDAFLVQKRTVGLITSFPVGDWTFENPTIVVNGLAPINQNIKSLTVGDVNSSFTPLAKNNAGIYLENNQNKVSYFEDNLIVPITSNSDLEIGAITAFFKYPADALQLNSVIINDDQNKNLVYATHEGLLSVSWTDTKAMNVKAGQELITLHFTVLSNKPQGYILSCLSDDGEIADPLGVPIESVVLSQPFINSDDIQTLEIGVYPNPALDFTVIYLLLPENGIADLSVYNNQGQKIKTLAQNYYLQGKHEIHWNITDDKGYSLTSGVYYLRLISAGHTKVVPVVILP